MKPSQIVQTLTSRSFQRSVQKFDDFMSYMTAPETGLNQFKVRTLENPFPRIPRVLVINSIISIGLGGIHRFFFILLLFNFIP